MGNAQAREAHRFFLRQACRPYEAREVVAFQLRIDSASRSSTLQSLHSRYHFPHLQVHSSKVLDDASLNLFLCYQSLLEAS
jgi:hypothetical protein